MINTILNDVQIKLLRMNYIERYGGIVIPVTAKATVESGRDYDITFPISCNEIGKTCFMSNDYYDLAPSDKYKSVAYWELQSDAVPFVPRRGNRVAWNGYRQTIRLVVWLNMLELGETETCNTMAEHLSILTVNELQGSHVVTAVDYLKKAKFTLQRKIRKSMDIFSGYSYRDRSELMLYPFDFFALDFEVEWYIRRDCIPAEQDYNQLCFPGSEVVEEVGAYSDGYSDGYKI